MVVYLVMRFKRYRINNHYGDYGTYHEEEESIYNIYLSEERAEQVAQELQEKWGNEDYDNEENYYVDYWEVVE